MTDPLRRKALTIIREGRLTVLMAGSWMKSNTVNAAIVQVQSSRPGVGPYVVDLLGVGDGQWTCTCRADAVCPHIRAAQLVTGHAPA